jgi:sulfur carrier protein
MSAIEVVVNGAPHRFGGGTTVADVVAALAPSPKGIAVAVNAALVPRSTWADTPVTGGDRIELLTAAQGG